MNKKNGFVEMSLDEFESFANEISNSATCETCEHCIYVGEGDSICDEFGCLIKEDFSPTDDYFCCNGKNFEG